MCGLLAMVAGQRIEPVAFTHALDTLAHRGPDGRGVWFNATHTVALGHRRLAIIDLETGSQPLANEDGTIVACVNGEFYDHRSLRRSLEQRGHRFRTNSDSEVLLHLYEDHGPACLPSLRGEFAFVLWDNARQQLFAARDRFGIKPLCWHQHDGRLLVASEAKALFALGVPRVWDRTTFFHVSAMQYAHPTETLFAGIAQLPPGHFLVAQREHVQVQRYWDITYHEPTDASPAQRAEQLRHELTSAVSLRLQADVPVCMHLSGGLDSTTIAALAQRQQPTPPTCFTVAFEDAAYDELAQAQQTATALGIALHVVPAPRSRLLDVLEQAVVQSEGLAINGHLPAKYLLAEAIRHAGFKVVLSGEGADEIFGGYAHLRQDLLEAEGGDIAALHAANATMAGIQLPHGEGLSLAGVQRRLGFIPTFLRAKATLGWRMRGLLRPEFVRSFADADPYEELLMHVPPPATHRVNQASYLWSKTALANYILRTLGDGTEMAHGVEGRLPFLDHHLVEWASTLPISAKIRDGVEKALLREAMAGLIPEPVRQRRKNPFTAPPFLANNTSPMVEQYLGEHALRTSPFFEPSAVQQYRQWVRLNPAEQVAADPVLMLVLTAQMMQAHYRLS